MGKSLKILSRIFSVLIIAAMLMGLFVSSISVNAASVGTIEKKQKKYDIAVVYDNSGSMYRWTYVNQKKGTFEGHDQKSWCQAKYAMEIFASMLDYENGDRLKIFTMWAVTTNPKNTSNTSFQVDINSNDDVDKITNMYTVFGDGSSNTPFEPAVEAYEYLQKSDATDKWLIVLSDGAFSGMKRNTAEDPSFDLQGELEAMAKGGVKVQYLYVGLHEPHDEIKKVDNYEEVYVKSKMPGPPVVEAKESKGLYVNTKASAETLKKDLVDICNRIFQRSELPSKHLKNGKLDLDISMSKLIVFVQGENAKINSLKDKDGNKIEVLSDSEQRKYSKVSADRFPSVPVDDTLYGQVVTFGAAAKGKYTLDISGADSNNIQIFYEPDVAIRLDLVDEKGKEIDLNTDEIQEIEKGEYTVKYTIVDKVTGKDVIESPLLGKDVDLKAELVKSDGSKKAIKNGEKINIEEDLNTQILVTGTYLKDFTITNENTGAGVGFKVVPELPDFNVDAKVEQPQSWYKISDNKNWKPIRINLAFDGKALTDDELKAVKLDIKMEPELTYHCEMLNGQSAYNVYVSHDSTGKFIEPKTGNYKFSVTATFTDKYDRGYKGNDSATFDIQTYDKFWIWLFWTVLIGGIILAWLLFMNQKVLPKKLEKENAEFSTMSAGDLGGNYVGVEYNRKGRSLKITTTGGVDSDERCTATFSLKPVDSRFKKSNQRMYKIVGIKSNCKSVSINNNIYVKNSKNVWVKETMVDNANPPPIGHEVGNGSFELVRGSEASTDAILTCKVIRR